MSSRGLCAALLLLVLLLGIGLADAARVPVHYRAKRLGLGSVIVGVEEPFHLGRTPFLHEGELAKITVEHDMLKTGWAIVNVTTNPDANATDDEIAYAAGMVEGLATAPETWDNYDNLYGKLPSGAANPSAIDPRAAQWLAANWAWMTNQVDLHKATSVYWRQVSVMRQQFLGFLDGVNAAGSRQMSFMQLAYLEATGDLYDILPALSVETTQNWTEYSRMMAFSHCSALVKYAADGSDIFFGHTTWSAYNNAIRQYKHYNFYFKDVAAQKVTFSGYPGSLSSVDDFYVLDSGLAVMETSFAISNMSLYNGTVVPESLLYWVRVMVANRLATTGANWTQIFARFNSGTYNNQWIVLDYNLFTPGQSLMPGTLLIAEQIPGQVGIRDVTDTLSRGYWPSYNLPAIPELYNLTGGWEAVEQFGPMMNSYDMCVRAQIFRRDQHRVMNITDMGHMMQYNDYLNDPISGGNPYYAISCRGDLASPAIGPQCFGGVDSKVTNYAMFTQGRQVRARSGPTQQQAPFSFLTTNATIGCGPNYGMPRTWDFSWQEFSE